MVKALSNIDIMKKTGCNFIDYMDMCTIKNIEILLNKPTLILYRIGSIGHFCCIFRNKQGINYFDSVGLPIDVALHFSKIDRDKYNHNYTYLTQLCYNTGQSIVFNEHQYQKMTSMACGYWCTLRMIYSHLTNEEFWRIFRSIKFNDNKICKLYNQIRII